MFSQAKKEADNNIMLITQLLDAGADINAKDARMRTPLSLATQGWTGEPALFLLEHGATFSELDGIGVPILYGAHRLPSVVKELIKRGANVNAMHDQRPIIGDYATSGPLESLIALIESGAHIDKKDSSGQTPLMHCVSRFRKWSIGPENEDPPWKPLLSHGADVHPSRQFRTNRRLHMR